jgi:hypothetical protein
MVEAAVLGNHDDAAVHPERVEAFNPDAARAARWTASQLTREHRDYLRALPLSVAWKGARLVHASPEDPESWNYVFRPVEAVREMAACAEPLCFVGHSHVPGTFELKGARATYTRDPSSPPRASGATWSWCRAWASRATATRARATCCGTTKRGRSSTSGSNTISSARWTASSRPGCRATWPSGCAGASDGEGRGANVTARVSTLGHWESYWKGHRQDIDDTYSTGGRLVREVLADGPVAGHIVMEIGAGSGRDLLELVRQGARGIVLDYSPASLSLVKDQAKAQGLSVMFVQADATRMPFRDGAIDIFSTRTARAFDPRPLLARTRASRVPAAACSWTCRRLAPHTLMKNGLILVNRWFAGRRRSSRSATWSGSC